MNTAIFLLLASCSGEPEPLPRYLVATVDDQPIAAMRYYDRLATLAVADRGPVITNAHRLQILDELIDEVLLVHHARSRWPTLEEQPQHLTMAALEAHSAIAEVPFSKGCAKE